MTIKNLLEQNNMSVYQLSKLSGVPYATANELCNQKANIAKCNAETVYRIAKILGVSVEFLLEPALMVRSSFENFKSAVCHRVKELGDIQFIYSVLKDKQIDKYYDNEWYPESLYLLSMLDYLCRLNDIPQCSDYDYIRGLKLEEMLLPASVIALDNQSVVEEAIINAIPEFISHNIVESEIRNVV